MLSVQQLRAIRLLAAGTNGKRTAELVGVTEMTMVNWKKEPEFKRHLVGLFERHNEVMRQTLLEGELEAATALREALTATDGEGNPQWKPRIQAATRLLDGRGERGKPMEEIQNRLTYIGGDDLGVALGRALRDPAVKAWIQTQPNILRAIPAETIEAEFTVEEIPALEDGLKGDDQS